MEQLAMLYRHGKMSRYSVPAGISDLAFPFCLRLGESAAATAQAQ